MMNVVVSEHLDEASAVWLAARATVVRHGHDQPGFADALRSAQGLVVRTYTQVDGALLDAAPRLRVVGRAGVGLDNVDVAACRSRGVEVVYTPDANAQAVVEYVLGLMLDRYRPRTPITRDQAGSFHAMRKTEVGVQLSSLTLGILGMGRIGKRLARAAEALRIPTLGCDVLDAAALGPSVPTSTRLVSHEDLYRQSDVLTVHIDGRASNRGVLDADVFAMLKPEVMLINAARGLLLDRQALRDWAERSPRACAVLDVHDPEPVPVEDPLWGLANVVLLPHLASRTHDALRAMSDVVHDVWAVLEGKAATYPAPLT